MTPVLLGPMHPNVWVLTWQALHQEADKAELLRQIASGQEAVQRCEHLDTEVLELETALAAERASASDNRANLEAKVRCRDGTRGIPSFPVACCVVLRDSRAREMATA